MIHDCSMISKSGQSSPIIVIICFSRIPLTAMASWSPLPQCQARVCQRWTQGWLPPHRLLLPPLRLVADLSAGSSARTWTLTAPETSSPASRATSAAAAPASSSGRPTWARPKVFLIQIFHQVLPFSLLFIFLMFVVALQVAGVVGRFCRFSGVKWVGRLDPPCWPL